MRKLIGSVALAALVAGPATAQVTLDQWGSFATLAHSDCADFCDPANDLSWFLGLTFEPSDGGAGVDTIDNTFSNARGDAFAEASVAVPLVPVVRVDASSAALSWTDGTGTAVQGFTYVGAVADTIDVNVHLTGTIANPDADPGTGLAAQVSYVGDANVAAFDFETAVQGLFSPDGAVQIEQSASGAVDQSDVLSIPVSPGDQFYLVASSAASAGGLNASAESLGTLTLTFDPADAANLQPANAPPAPNTLPALGGPGAALLALGLAALAVRRLSRRS